MQTKSKIILSVFLLAAIPSLCSAAANNLNTTGPGEQVELLGANMATTTLPDFTFQPSTNVVIEGTSTAQSFALAAWHNSSLNTENGEGYGMASDVSGVFTLPLDGVTAPTVPTTGSGDDFASPWKAPLGATEAAAADPPS